MTNIEYKEKDLGKANYFDNGIIFNIKAALGKNPFGWLIPFGTGWEPNIKLLGYDFYCNSTLLVEYTNIKLKQKELEMLKKNANLPQNSSSAIVNNRQQAGVSSDVKSNLLVQNR